MNASQVPPTTEKKSWNPIIGSLGLLVISASLITQFDRIMGLAKAAFVQPSSDSILSALFVGIFTQSFSAITMVSAIGIVMVRGTTKVKVPILVITILVLTAAEYHWPANWASRSEWPAIATLMFLLLLGMFSIKVISLMAKALCGWQLVGDENEIASTRSIALNEFLALTALAALTIAIGRQSMWTLRENLHWSLGTVAYAAVLSIRLLSLAEVKSVRNRARVIGIFAFAGLRIVQEIWPFDDIPDLSWPKLTLVLLAAMTSGIVYWFMTMVPILWMQANQWRVVSGSPSCSFEQDDVPTPA
jgi:hypothetical protein